MYTISKLVPACKGRFMRTIHRFLLGPVFSTTSAPTKPVCARIDPLPEKTGLRSSFSPRIVIRSDPVVVVIHALWVWFILVPLLECLDPLLGHRYNYPRSVELRIW